MQQAALTLFAELGYTGTTAAEIANRAGVTERTFFRHFSDKREVLFAGEDEMLDYLTAAVAAAPEEKEPVEAVTVGLAAVAGKIQERREVSEQRARIIAAHTELQERELKKLASWSDAIEDALCERSLSRPAAQLLAEVSVAVFRVAYGRWIDGGSDSDFVATLCETFAELGELIGHAAPRP